MRAWRMALIQHRGPGALLSVCSECSIALLFGIQLGMFCTHFMPLTAASGAITAPLSASYEEPDVQNSQGMFPECLCKTVGKSRTKEAGEACKRQAKHSFRGFHGMSEKHYWHWQTAYQGMHAPHALRSLSP